MSPSTKQTAVTNTTAIAAIRKTLQQILRHGDLKSTLIIPLTQQCLILELCLPDANSNFAAMNALLNWAPMSMLIHKQVESCQFGTVAYVITAIPNIHIMNINGVFMFRDWCESSTSHKSIEMKTVITMLNTWRKQQEENHVEVKGKPYL